MRLSDASGPRYTPGGVAIVALNMNISPNDDTDPIYEYWISYEQHIHWLAAGYQKNDGSRFAFGAHRSAAARLDAQGGRPVVDRLPEQLPDTVLSTARLQAVKCLPKRARSKPSSAMRRLCAPMVLVDELDVLRPGTVLVRGAVAYDAVAGLDAFGAVPCRSRRGTLRRREWQADVCKVVHPSYPGARAAPSELALIQHLSHVSRGRHRRVAPSTED